jgi:hypothetical protein
MIYDSVYLNPSIIRPHILQAAGSSAHLLGSPWGLRSAPVAQKHSSSKRHAAGNHLDTPIVVVITTFLTPIWKANGSCDAAAYTCTLTFVGGVVGPCVGACR